MNEGKKTTSEEEIKKSEFQPSKKESSETLEYKQPKDIELVLDENFLYRPLKWYYFIPIMIVIAIVPLITFGKEVILNQIEVYYWKGGERSLDFFSYYKSIIFSVASIVSFLLLIVLRFAGKFKIKETKYYIPLAIYIVFVIASYLFSDYFTVSYRGFIEQFQGVWVMIGYAFIMASVYNYVDNKKQIKLILYTFIFSSTLIGLLGISQYFGFDFFKTEFGRYLILPNSLHEIAENLKFTFSKHTIYATMYNTNFVGSFASLLLPMSIFLFLYSKKILHKLLSLGFATLMYFVWIGCNSRAGYLGMSFAIILMIVLYRKKLKDDIFKIALMIVIFSVLTIFMNNVSGGRVLGQFARLNPIAEKEILEEILEQGLRYEDIVFDGNSVTFITNKESFKVKLLDDGSLVYFDEKDNKLGTEENKDGEISFVDDRYESFKVIVDDNISRFFIMAHGTRFDIYMRDEGFMMAGSSGVLKKTQYPPYIKLFEGREKFLSSRGYIWSRSIPMLKDTILIGHGPDTYAMEFPQYDFVGKLNGLTNHRMIVDKPHNMYLQIGINTGIISLLALIALFIMYFIDSMRIFFNRKIVSYLDYIGLGAFIGVMAYLVAGMFNDQIISVAPLFYSMVGLGLAVNRLIKKAAN